MDRFEFYSNAKTYEENSLKHYGTIGQKWGVRRTPEELGHYTKKRFYELVDEGAITTKNGTKVTRFSEHAYKQSKLPERKVEYGSIVNALRNPLRIKPVRYNDQGEPSQQFIGKKATVAVNPDNGVITTVWPTHSKLAEKLSK